MIFKKSAKKVLSNRSIFNKIKILVVTPIGSNPFPREMFLFFIKLTNHSIFTILF